MKSTLKYLALFLISLIAIISSLLIILSFDAKKGALAALAVIIICGALFCLSIFGIVKGNLKYMLLRNRIEVVGLMGFSIFLTLFAGLTSFGNAVIEIGLEERDWDAEQKARYVASTFFTVPSQKNLIVSKKNDINYFYPEDSEEYIDQFDELLQQEKKRFDLLFGPDDNSDLTIEIHDNYETLQMGNPIDDVAGYYSGLNDTLYLYPVEGEWENVLLHEYTHYRIDQFSEAHDLELTRIPQWFQEGVSEYMGTLEQYLMDYEQLETVDFHLLDSNDSYHEAGTEYFDPYIQSHLAVQVLIEENGEAIIPELLEQETIDSFYNKLEEIMAKDMKEFEEYFVEKLIADRNIMNARFDEAYIAFQKKEYDKAIELAKNIKKDGREFDIEEADMLLKDIYLEKDSFAEAAAVLEEKIDTGYEFNRLTNLLLLVEVYILDEPEKAKEKLLQAQESAKLESYRLEELVQIEEAIDKIVAGERNAGYIELIEKDLIMQEKIREELMERVVNSELPEV